MESFKRGMYLGGMWTRQFFKDSKFIVVLLFSFLFLFVYITPLRQEAALSDYGITPYILPLIYDMNTMYMAFVMILLVCDAPFIQKNQLFVNVRAGMASSFIGKVIYLFFISVILQVIQFLISIFMLIPYISFSDNWGYILTKVVSEGFSEPVIYSGFAARISVMEEYTGLEALAGQVLLNISFTFLMGMAAFFLNGIIKKYLGPIVLIFIAIFDSIINAAGFWVGDIYKLYDYSLIRFIKLSAVNESNRTIMQNVIIMWVISAVFIIITYIAFKIRFKEREV